MADLMLSLDGDLADTLARLAEERHVGVNQFVKTELAKVAAREDSRRRLRQLVNEAPLQLEPGWKWNREDSYDRPMLRGYKRPPIRGDGAP